MTLFLLKVIGIYFIVVSLAVLMNRKWYVKLMKEIFKNNFAIFITGFVTLILGLLLVLSHNLWGNLTEILISAIAWMAFLKGAFLLIYPQKVEKLTKKMLNESYISLSISVYLLLGLYFCWLAFFS